MRHICQDDRLAQEWMELFEHTRSVTVAEEPALPTLAIANPPYATVPTNRQDYYPFYQLVYQWKEDVENTKHDRLGTFRPTSKQVSRVSLSALFSEVCLNQLAIGEVAVLLVDNGLLSAKSAKYARVWLLNAAELVSSIQLPQTVWVESGSSGPIASFLVWRRRPVDPDEDYSIFMAVADTCGCDSRGRKVYKRDKKTGCPIEPAQIDDDLIEIMSEYESFICVTMLESKCGIPGVNSRSSNPEKQPEQHDAVQWL